MRGNPAQVIQDSRKADKAGTASDMMFDVTGRDTTYQVDSFGPLMNAITFPQGLGDDPAQPFFMTYVPKKITSAVGGTMGDMSFSAVNVTKDNISQVALPIPTGINVAYAQGWDATDVNAVQGSVMRSQTFKNSAASMQNVAGDSNLTGEEVGKAAARVGGRIATQAGEMFEDGKNALAAAVTAGPAGTIELIQNKIAAAGVSGNAVAGVTLGVAGKLLGPAMSTAAGFSSFNQTMAHYQGPAFRNFNFTYTLRPLEPKDQQNIVKIVNFFKIASAPSQISNGLFRIYELPYVFKIGFHSKKGELADVNKIAHCACTNVSVSYGGDRFQTFSGTNSPVETNISLTFKEIELITRTEMEAGY